MWIKETVEDITKKYKTNDPYEIIAAKNIILVERDMHEDIYGFYKYIRRNKFIFLNSKLSDAIKKFTSAHELGHVELHSKTNTPFLRRKTLLSVDKIEQEANRFAVEMLLPDKSIHEYKNTNLSIKEIGGIHGVPNEVIHLKKF
ncbi:ImmA/IrrE family metallo-endopeptidase [Oceanobacillus sp. J11TS1]|uniref:ImmA/IrrE family metallo-endopeptidase n=1 Tax=Oceanobacillus sp. J11TS1 TaxID=2807191 RepID=UPI001B2B64D9|nr:ImmA/IrrE family metallo-endopeptidase [Oceanobacillus sp. J11TS1]GIO23926.1 ImmA/IrrE family metallo-endopeptidase [Oceanobacillus sp. J11TS1]